MSHNSSVLSALHPPFFESAPIRKMSWLQVISNVTGDFRMWRRVPFFSRLPLYFALRRCGLNAILANFTFRTHCIEITHAINFIKMENTLVQENLKPFHIKTTQLVSKTCPSSFFGCGKSMPQQDFLSKMSIFPSTFRNQTGQFQLFSQNFKLEPSLPLASWKPLTVHHFTGSLEQIVSFSGKASRISD